MCWRLIENCGKYSGADKNSTQVRNEQQHRDNTPGCFSERILMHKEVKTLKYTRSRMCVLSIKLVPLNCVRCGYCKHPILQNSDFIFRVLDLD